MIMNQLEKNPTTEVTESTERSKIQDAGDRMRERQDARKSIWSFPDLIGESRKTWIPHQVKCGMTEKGIVI